MQPQTVRFWREKNKPTEREKKKKSVIQLGTRPKNNLDAITTEPLGPYASSLLIVDDSANSSWLQFSESRFNSQLNIYKSFLSKKLTKFTPAYTNFSMHPVGWLVHVFNLIQCRSGGDSFILTNTHCRAKKNTQKMRKTQEHLICQRHQLNMGGGAQLLEH